MRELPIIFAAPMIQALLARRKRVTRRLSKQWLRVKAGDRLWVREAWGIGGDRLIDPCLNYRADGVQRPVNRHSGGDDLWYPFGSARGITTYELLKPSLLHQGGRSSLHMPRWASRILLECEEDARLERLQDITADDAIAEGVETCCNGTHYRCYGAAPHAAINHYADPRDSFASLWRTLHTKPGTRWEDDPEIVRVGQFHVIDAEGRAA